MKNEIILYENLNEYTSVILFIFVAQVIGTMYMIDFSGMTLLSVLFLAFVLPFFVLVTLTLIIKLLINPRRKPKIILTISEKGIFQQIQNVLITWNEISEIKIIEGHLFVVGNQNSLPLKKIELFLLDKCTQEQTFYIGMNAEVEKTELYELICKYYGREIYIKYTPKENPVYN